MIAERATEYYMQKNMNCAETLMHSVCDEYGWELPDDAFHAMSGFGGGCGCGNLCGAVAASIAAIGMKLVKTRAHDTPDLRHTCARFMADFKARANSTECKYLRAEYFDKDTHCLPTILIACQLLQEYLDR